MSTDTTYRHSTTLLQKYQDDPISGTVRQGRSPLEVLLQTSESIFKVPTKVKYVWRCLETDQHCGSLTQKHFSGKGDGTTVEVGIRTVEGLIWRLTNSTLGEPPEEHKSISRPEFL